MRRALLDWGQAVVKQFKVLRAPRATRRYVESTDARITLRSFGQPAQILEFCAASRELDAASLEARRGGRRGEERFRVARNSARKLRTTECSRQFWDSSSYTGAEPSSSARWYVSLKYSSVPASIPAFASPSRLSSFLRFPEHGTLSCTGGESRPVLSVIMHNARLQLPLRRDGGWRRSQSWCTARLW